MRTRPLAIATFLLLLGAGASPGFAQKAPDGPQGQGGGVMQHGPDGGMGPGMMSRGMMRPGMMGRGMMGFGDMRAMRIAFILMDGDGDGSLSVEEFRAGHDRIFKGLDANKDGRLTVEEIGAFMQGSGGSPRAPDR
jgi:hypothetical protein